MKRATILPVFIMLFLFVAPVRAQDIPDDACRVEEGSIIFKFDLKWSKEMMLKMQEVFDLDSLVIDAVVNGLPEVQVGDERWQTRRISNSVTELVKPVVPDKGDFFSWSDLMLLDDSWIRDVYVDACASYNWGLNRFSVPDVFDYSDSIAKFTLKAYRDAKEVFIAGTFNQWSTGSTPMTKTGEGWTVSIRLNPCRYAYKFIVDGRWIHDPANELTEGDTHGGYNSVVFCYNHIFLLPGYKDARKVYVSGSFNNWKRKELPMNRTETGWELPIYLREGTHAYKFIVDKKWMVDPENQVIRPDGSGNFNSFIGIGDTMYFTLEGYPEAKNVVVAGSFNAWNTGELFMNRTTSGWELPYVLSPGNYEYKFIVDGRWMPDPANPYTTGSGDYTNSLGSLKPNHIFELENYESASNVIVAGSFNGWNPDGYRMIRSGGKWILPIHLRAGKHTYKFIVDGNWIIDPSNELWEQNEHGTGNSVLWIEP